MAEVVKEGGLCFKIDTVVALGSPLATYLNVKSDPLFHISAYVRQVGQWIPYRIDD